MLVETEVAQRIRPLTFDEVLRMAEAGIFGHEERLELVDGVLVRMSPEGFAHADTIVTLNGMLSRAYPWPEYRVRVNTTQPLGEIQYRLPDVEITRPTGGRWPDGSDALLVLEVALTSIRYDLGRKARDYSEWGALEYWVVDLARCVVVVHTEPSDAGYGSVVTLDAQDTLVLPDDRGTLAISEILSPPSETGA